MSIICKQCFSNQVYPITGASLNYPESPTPTLCSPTVLASLGKKICHTHHINPMVGMVAGAIIGVGLSIWQSSGKALFAEYSLYYCQNCQNVFNTTLKNI